MLAGTLLDQAEAEVRDEGELAPQWNDCDHVDEVGRRLAPDERISSISAILNETAEMDESRMR